MNALMTLSPPRVSSTIDRNSPCSFCTLSDFFLSDLPILEMMAPASGIKIKTNKVEAKFDNGLLEVHMPKADDSKPKEVKISLK